MGAKTSKQVFGLEPTDVGGAVSREEEAKLQENERKVLEKVESLNDKLLGGIPPSTISKV